MHKSNELQVFKNDITSYNNMNSIKGSVQGVQTVSVFSKCAPDMRRNIVRQMIQLAVNALEGKSITEGALEKVQSQVGTIQQVYELYAIILNIVQAFVHLPPGSIKVESLKEGLKELKFPEESVSDFVNVLYGPKREVWNKTLCKSDFHLKLEKLRWRVDITITSSVLSRVLEPNICIEMLLNNGRCCTCELSISKFHELRYNVASVLKEMESIEKRKLLKGTG